MGIVYRGMSEQSAEKTVILSFFLLYILDIIQYIFQYNLTLQSNVYSISAFACFSLICPI